MMKKYVRVNIVDAEPMTRGDCNAFRGWTTEEVKKLLDNAPSKVL